MYCSSVGEVTVVLVGQAAVRRVVLAVGLVEHVHGAEAFARGHHAVLVVDGMVARVGVHDEVVEPVGTGELVRLDLDLGDELGVEDRL